MQGWACNIALLAGILLSCVASAAQTYTVTRTDDPAPNGCQVGDCSLREAVLEANSVDGLDTVQLAAATYSVDSTIEITGQLRIAGADAAQTHVVASGELDPLLQLFEGAPTYLILRNLSIDARGGKEIKGNASASLAAELVAAPNPEGSVYLTFGTGGVMDVNRSEFAGYFGCQGCRLVVVDRSEFGTVQLLQADPDVAYEVRMRDVVVDGVGRPNSYFRLASLGTVSLIDLTVQNTRAGIRIESAPESLIVDGLRYLGNREAFEVDAGADFTIANSEFRDNAPTMSGQPAALWIRSAGAHVVVVDSTFANNTGTSNTGGAVLVEGGAELSLRNTTFVDNSFSVNASADGARGAAIGYRTDPAGTVLTLQNVTIVAPTIMPVGAQGSALGGRGAAGADVLLNLYNSVLAGSCRSDGVVPDFAIGNVKTTGDNCGFGSGNLTGVPRADLALGPLGDHGGMTATVLPGPGSVVIDAGNDFGCLDTDQRGSVRPSGLRCDAGAIEIDDAIFADGFD